MCQYDLPGGPGEAGLGNEVVEDFGEGDVVGAGIAHVGEYLSEGFFVVLVDESFAVGAIFYLGVILAADVGGGFVEIGFAMHYGLDGQAVSRGALVGGESDGECGDGDDHRGEVEGFGYLRGVVGSGAEVAAAEASLLCDSVELLGKDGGVEYGRHERLEVVVGGVGT